MPQEPLRVTAALVVSPDDRIFFQKRSATRKLFPNSWDVVGGHLEPGETVSEALAREITEETGWELSEVLATVGDYRYTGEDGLERWETDFLVRVRGDLSRPQLEAGKHTDFRWLGPDELDVLDENREVTDGMIRQLAEDGFAVLRTLSL
ncbi:NUDIX domain-containing protein [Actinoplanes sp. TFC3]|uniref:NUDIX domain-containing protein n=1 Tax=Actinoplanes sp. TFC3 TaxID=1710355 RepID=UPI00082A70AC|nr:NUDIX domain-containing protein [Actinoplanes sp. TFC3]